MTDKSLKVLAPRELSAASGRTEIAVSTPALTPLVKVGGPISATLMRWTAVREARTYRALAESTRAQTDFVNARGDLAQSLLATARMVAELRELPQVLEHDAQVRELRRDSELATAQREAAEARYGLDATRDEIADLRAKRRKKVAVNEKVARNALTTAKLNLEAAGHDTTAIDDAMARLAPTNGVQE
jgi:hypothetical protein